MKQQGFSFKVRIIHMLCFEIFGVLIFAPFAAWVLKESILTIGALGVVISLMAMIWNFIYNILFDHVENKLGKDRFKRGPITRIIHAFLFEFGLLIATLPLVAFWLNMSLWMAFVTDMSFVIFYLVYAYVFNWTFDQCYLFLIKKNATN